MATKHKKAHAKKNQETERRVYLIGPGAALAPGASPEEMGFKGYNLARMAAKGTVVKP